MELVDRLDGRVRFTLLPDAAGLIGSRDPGYVLDPQPQALETLLRGGMKLVRIPLGATRSQAYLTQLRTATADAPADAVSLWRIESRENM